jgi:hypothetical protein
MLSRGITFPSGQVIAFIKAPLRTTYYKGSVLHYSTTIVQRSTVAVALRALSTLLASTGILKSTVLVVVILIVLTLLTYQVQ